MRLPRSRIAAACALAAIVLAGACVGFAPIPKATRADAALAAAHWPGTTLAQLNRGRGILLAHCGACHDPPHPDRFPPAEWPVYVNRMRGRAGLSRVQTALVAKYLMTISARGRGGDNASARR